MAGITFGRFAAAVPVSDIGRALAFYQDTLGMTVTFTNGDPTGFVILRRDAAELHLTLVRGHRAGLHNVAHLMVADATALHDHLVASGVRIVKGLRDADYGLRGFVMADPDGNRIDVGQRLLRQCGAHRDRALGAVGRRPAGLRLEPGRDRLRCDQRMALLVQGEHLRAEVPALRVALAPVRIHRDLHRPSLHGRTVPSWSARSERGRQRPRAVREGTAEQVHAVGDAAGYLAGRRPGEGAAEP